MAISMSPQELVERLKHALPAALRSVILHGSAAASDHEPAHSDYNVLVVAEPLGLPELEALVEPVAPWLRAGNPAPTLMTPAELARSADAFPIELSDLARSRLVLYGADLFGTLEIKPEHLRLQLERELKGKLLDLRSAYLRTRGDAYHMRELMVQSLPAFLVLARAALGLFQTDVPAHKLDAWRALAHHAGCDAQVFLDIQNLRGQKGLARWRPDATLARARFEAYLRTIEQVVEAVDRRIRCGT